MTRRPDIVSYAPRYRAPTSWSRMCRAPRRSRMPLNRKDLDDLLVQVEGGRDVGRIGGRWRPRFAPPPAPSAPRSRTRRTSRVQHHQVSCPALEDAVCVLGPSSTALLWIGVVKWCGLAARETVSCPRPPGPGCAGRSAGRGWRTRPSGTGGWRTGRGRWRPRSGRGTPSAFSSSITRRTSRALAAPRRRSTALLRITPVGRGGTGPVPKARASTSHIASRSSRCARRISIPQR